MMTFATDEQDVPVIFGIFNEVDQISLSPVVSFAFRPSTQSRHRCTELGKQVQSFLCR